MQLALTILAGFGALLFIFSFLAYVVSGFKHHFVTGLIAALPVLNIVTLPSLWDKNSGKFFAGFIGLIITAGAWFMGADEGVQNLVSRQGFSNNREIVVATASNNSPQTSGTATSRSPKKINNTVFNESKMTDLPNKALYKMGFDVVPVSKIGALQGRIVQIIKTNNEQVEGRIKRISASSVVLDGLFENELPIASIKQLKLMVKKSNE